MQFVISLEDIHRWFENFLGVDVQVRVFQENQGQVSFAVPDVGLLKLLPPGFHNYWQFFEVEQVEANSVTLNMFGADGSDDDLYSLFIRYVNYTLGGMVMEQRRFGKLIVHLDKIRLTREMKLQSLRINEEGLMLDFEDNTEVYERLRIIQMLLRAGYTNVAMVSEEQEYSGYWFSDDSLQYTLVTADHPADMRMWSSFYVMDWLGMADKLTEDYFRPSFPNEKIHYQYGNVTVVIPLTIAEPEINLQTIERNCERLKCEIAQILTGLWYDSFPNQYVL
jgi:hypothetical protein